MGGCWASLASVSPDDEAVKQQFEKACKLGDVFTIEDVLDPAPTDGKASRTAFLADPALGESKSEPVAAVAPEPPGVTPGGPGGKAGDDKPPGGKKLTKKEKAAAAAAAQEAADKAFTPPAWLTPELASHCLMRCCASVTHERIVDLLIRRGRANPNTQNVYGNTPLHMCTLRKDISEKLLEHRYQAAVVLIAAGANVNHANREGLTALCLAAQEENERLGLLLGEKGARMWTLYKWTTLSKQNGKNWVAGAVLCRHAFSDDDFIANLEAKIMALFDKDTDNRLNRDEMKSFIKAFAKVSSRSKYYKEAMKIKRSKSRDRRRGEISKGDSLKSVKSFVDMSDDWMRREFKIDLSRDPEDKLYAFKDILPLVKHFYRDAWNHNRPNDGGWASFREKAVKQVAVAERDDLEYNSAAKLQAMARGRHVRAHMSDIKETQMMEKQRRTESKAAVSIQSAARGRVARQEVTKLREEKHRKEEAAEEAQIRDKAATKIQAIARGNSERRLLAKRRDVDVMEAHAEEEEEEGEQDGKGGEDTGGDGGGTAGGGGDADFNPADFGLWMDVAYVEEDKDATPAESGEASKPADAAEATTA